MDLEKMHRLDKKFTHFEKKGKTKIQEKKRKKEKKNRINWM